MSKISLRLRLTLITLVVMIILCGGLTLTSILNAKESFSTFATPVDIMQRVIIPAEKIEATFVPLEEIGEEYTAALMSTINLSYNVGVTQFKWTNIIIMIVAIFLSTAIVWFFSGIALKPLKKFANEIQEVNEKDLSFRVNSPNSKDEISNLSKSFNAMMEKLDQAFSREKRFTDGIVHELNTPLAVIKTNIDVLDDDPSASKEEIEETLTLVKQQTQRMIDLVEQMRNLSRKEKLEKETFDLEETLIDVTNDLKDKAKSSQMEITLNSFPTKVYGSKVLLKQCVTNLVDNAIKYASSGKSVELSLSEDEEFALINVSDRGKGIGKEDRMKIFEPFYRVDQSRSRLTAGAGLGLSIAKEIVSIHGGDLTCEENRFGGCDFKITLKKNPPTLTHLQTP